MLMKVLTRAPTIILFFGLLFLPLIWQLIRFPQYTQLEEYRKLADRPSVRAYVGNGKWDFLGYTKQFNTYYSDRFATRPIWVRLYTQTMYSLFHESDQLHIGKDGWLFYRSIIDRETPQMEAITPQFRQALVGKLARTSELLEEKGITLYVMPVTTKNRFYPEFLPASAAHARSFRFYDTFVNELIANKQIHVLDSRKTLEEAKAAGLKIYHQTDFHWTDPAGALAIKPLVHELGAREGKLDLADSWSYDIVPDPQYAGGQARALPLFKTPTEHSIGVKIVRPQTTFDNKFNENGMEWSGIAEPGQGERLSPIFVYGDSYFDAEARAGFFNLFQAFGRARLYSNDLTEAFRHRPAGTRYMVLEFISTATLGVDNYVTPFLKTLETDPNL